MTNDSIYSDWTNAVMKAREKSKEAPPKYISEPAKNRSESLSPEQIQKTLEEISEELSENYLSNGKSVDDLRNILSRIYQEYPVNALSSLILRTRSYADRLSIAKNKRPTWIAERLATEYERTLKQ